MHCPSLISPLAIKAAVWGASQKGGEVWTASRWPLRLLIASEVHFDSKIGLRCVTLFLYGDDVLVLAPAASKAADGLRGFWQYLRSIFISMLSFEAVSSSRDRSFWLELIKPTDANFCVNPRYVAIYVFVDSQCFARSRSHQAKKGALTWSKLQGDFTLIPSCGHV